MSKKNLSCSRDPQQKSTILRRHLIDKIPVSDLCDEYKISPSSFYKWQKDLFDNAAEALEPRSKNKRALGVPNKKIESLEKKIIQKNEVIAELMQEHVNLKKQSGEIQARFRLLKLYEMKLLTSSRIGLIKLSYRSASYCRGLDCSQVGSTNGKSVMACQMNIMVKSPKVAGC